MNKWNLVIYSPAYNVENTINKLLLRTDEAAKKLETKKIFLKKFIIINDGSTDNTKEILENLSKKYKYLTIINKPKNKGSVDAVLEGMEIVDKTDKSLGNAIILRMDTDMEHDPVAILPIIYKMANNEADVCIGESNFRNYPVQVRIFNQLFGRIESRTFLNTDIAHFCPGMYATNKKTLKKVLPVIKELKKQFEIRYNKPMLAIDFISAVIAKHLGLTVIVQKLPPIERKWVRKPTFKKILTYMRYHFETVEFLKSLNFGGRV